MASGKARKIDVGVMVQGAQAASALPLVLMLPPQRRKRSSIRRDMAA
jgi:hypothetical protein